MNCTLLEAHLHHKFTKVYHGLCTGNTYMYDDYLITPGYVHALYVPTYSASSQAYVQSYSKNIDTAASFVRIELYEVLNIFPV
jgi:hypothetical protein